MPTLQATGRQPSSPSILNSPATGPPTRKNRTPVNQNKKPQPSPSAVGSPLSALRHPTPGPHTRKKPTSVNQKPARSKPTTPKDLQTSANGPRTSQRKTQKAAARLQKVQLFFEANPQIFARQGTVAATWRTYKGKRLGPYYQLTYRHQDRQHWLYLGRSEQLANQVRELLNHLHRPRDERRINRRLLSQARVSLRLAKAQLKQACADRSITLKGWEFRGVREAVLRFFPSPRPIRPAPT